MENIYIVSIYHADENCRENKFATHDKNDAEKFCNKFNRIIQNNRERIESYYNDYNYNKPSPLWYDLIYMNRIIAIFEELKIK